MTHSSKFRSQDYVWLLNPDAELELAHAARSAPRSYSPKGDVVRSMESKRALFVDLTLGEPWCFLNVLERCAPGKRGLLWCQTPGAVERAARAGFSVSPAPSWQCLLRVHDKTHLSDLVDPCLPSRTVVNSQLEWDAAVSRLMASQSTLGSCARVRAKRPYGFAGRGQRTLPAHLSKDDERWITDSLRQGALVIEPEIEGARLASIHGIVEEHDALVGELLEFGEAPSAHFTETSKIHAERMATNVAAALLAEGYTGPFGLDLIFNQEGAPFALDLNPRFTLRWSAGLGKKRESAIERLLARIPRTR